MVYPGVRIRQKGNLAFVQPVEEQRDEAPTLKINLKNGSVQIVTEPLFQKECLVAPGIMGVVKMKEMAVLVVIKATKQVATVNGNHVFKVTETDLILPETKSTKADDARYLMLLRTGVDPNDHGRGLHFSYTMHLTKKQEASGSFNGSNASSGHFWENEDERFFFNKQICKAIIEAGGHKFVLPVMQGFVQELPGLIFSKGPQWGVASLTLIARRSIQRIGTRHWRRGADRQGQVANFVETEQIVNFDNGKHISSFVQVRGSIPIFWTQIPNIKYKPPTKISPKEAYSPAFAKHIEKMVAQYKEVVALSLVNQHGSEGRLSEAFVAEASGYPGGSFKLIPFDFHKECGKSRYHRISVLFDKIKDDFERFSYFRMEVGQVVKKQGGVFRTNCIDCLDRTNVVQGVFGRKALETFLTDLGFLSQGESLPSKYPAVEQQFKILWADHGDECSLQYAGTGALKSGFTRTGKRTMGGYVDDGIKSCVRYYLNNFQDGKKQDALDFVTGGGEELDERWSPFQQQPSASLPLLLTFLLLFFGISQVFSGVGSAGLFSQSTQLGFVSLLAAFGILFLVVNWGPNFVNKPQLRTDLSKQW